MWSVTCNKPSGGSMPASFAVSSSVLSPNDTCEPNDIGPVIVPSIGVEGAM